MADSNRRRSRRKSEKAPKPLVDFPKKPRPGFPLYPHKGWKQWAKKVCGKTHYFGRVEEDPQGVAALEKWLEQKEDLLAGREPGTGSRGETKTVRDVVNQFLTKKEGERDTGELSPRTFHGLYATCANLVKALGKDRVVGDLRPDDFRRLREKLSKTRGLVALSNEMQRVRSVFKFAFDEGRIDKPVAYGRSFDRPKPNAIRRARATHQAAHGLRMFEADQLRVILAEAGQPLRSMILLAANCAFGQSDLGSLPLRAVDLDAGWINYPRPKTGVARRAPLWPETVAAIREWLPMRPAAKDKADEGLMFLTSRGGRWVKVTPRGAPVDALSGEFSKLLRELGLKRPGLAFYAIRHGFETIAGETTDQVAVDLIMGHVPRGMSAAYRERVGNDRLVAVSEHVRRWLFEATDEPNPAKPEPKRTAVISLPRPAAECFKANFSGEGPKLQLFDAQNRPNG